MSVDTRTNSDRTQRTSGEFNPYKPNQERWWIWPYVYALSLLIFFIPIFLVESPIYYVLGLAFFIFVPTGLGMLLSPTFARFVGGNVKAFWAAVRAAREEHAVQTNQRY